MPKIENKRVFIGRDKRGIFVMTLITLKEARYGHISVYRNDCLDDVKILQKRKAKMLYWIARIRYGRS